MWDGGAGRWTLRKLKAKRPTLSMQGGDMLYLTVVSKKGHNGRQSRHLKVDNQKLTIGIDLRKKTVEMLALYDDDDHVQPFTFSQHMNTRPTTQQNMWNTHGYYNGSLVGYVDAMQSHYAYGIYQHPPLWSPSMPQNLLGSGNIIITQTKLVTLHYPFHQTLMLEIILKTTLHFLDRNGSLTNVCFC
jgi:hypothetical protein